MGISTGAAILGAGALSAGASYLASSNQADAATQAAQTQANASQAGIQNIQQMYAKNAPYWYPYTNLGQQGTTAISSMLPYFTHQFTPSDLQTQLAPNYQFMLGQGLGATKQAQNVTGGGSNMTRAADLFAQNYAQNAYQQAFNNYQTGRSNIYNTLSSIAGIGQQGAAGLSNLGAGVATNVANLTGQAGAASAAGQIGAANAQAAGLTNVASNISNAGMLYGLTGGFGSSGNQTQTGGQSVAPANWQSQSGWQGNYIPGVSQPNA